MQVMTEREADRRLDGLVQWDDAYLGGERNGGKAGRGLENKRPFGIAVSTDESGRPRHAVIDPVSGFTKAALAQWTQCRLQPGLDVYNDDLGAFRALEEQGHAHTVIDSQGRAGCEQEHTRWVNIVLSHLKRSLDGAYHAFAYFKYAHRYLAEAAWRFNRRFDLAALMPHLLVAAAMTRPWSERKLRDVPVYASCRFVLIRFGYGELYKAGLRRQLSHTLRVLTNHHRSKDIIYQVQKSKEGLLPIHLLQNWFGYSDPAMEETLYQIASLRQFARLSLLDAIPDETTLLNFGHPLERHGLAARLDQE